MIKKVLNIIMCGLCACSMQAQTTLSLDECIKQALLHNQKLRQADNQILMSTEQRKEAFTKYFPTVSATGMGMAANENLIQMDIMGMGIGLVKNGVAASVSAMQPLFAGGQIVNGNKLARVGEEVSRLQRTMTENEVRLTTETYYWQIIMLQEKLKTVGLVEKQLESVQRDAQAAVDAGLRNRNDLLQVNLKKNEMRTTRIKLENNISVLQDLLGQMMGVASARLASPPTPLQGEGSDMLPDSKNNEQENVGGDVSPRRAQQETQTSEASIGGEVPRFALKQETQASPAVHSPLLGEGPGVRPSGVRLLYISPEQALSSTTEYRLLDKQVEAARLQRKLSVGKNLPTVAIGGAYLYNNLMDKSANKLVGLVTVSVPISSWWGGSHDIKRQKLQLENAEIARKDQSEQLIIRMRKAWNDLTDASKQVDIARESIQQSEENLRLNTDYYQAGTATISDLLDAQTLYQQSHDQYVEASTQYQIKKREYLQATGR